MDYKTTLQLPQTDFAMKADLARREPEFIARWNESKLYQQILAARQGAEVWVLHDGPPYANGHIHYGHILNKILKDIVCKSRTMMGHYVEFRPGWDCHGLPIELAVLREHGEKAQHLSPVEVRQACEGYAQNWVATQRDEFIRLGVFATWEKPYLTLDRAYEAAIIRTLAAFARKGLLYRDLKPVHWCVSDKTALAEAEIEYDEAHESPSIYVKFAIPSEANLYAVIWTTTPWTLPANHAIAYHPEFAYVSVSAKGERYIVAEKLADTFVKQCKLEESAPRQPIDVANFAAWGSARHPFLDRASRFLPADYVTLEQGTGLVHTAPGHGADDYILGKSHGLPVDAPVDDSGKFVSGAWQGLGVFEANPKIVAALAESGALLSHPNLKVKHSYPICWRCKNPIIFRATWQWFARMDGAVTPDQTLRKSALDEIGRTSWIPPWGENRIRGMIETRPDWVLSRQRAWGVPIPVFEKDGEFIADAEVMEKIADKFAEAGSDVWFTQSAEELLGEKYRGYEKGRDIVDVWFESGVSWAAVCAGQKGLDSSTPSDPRPADLYLEGSDQHRGWFHSSLLASCAATGHAPYRAVLTHGFVLDDRGKPYSKSEIEKARREGKKVEYIPPENVLKENGAELLRLWVAQADFRHDIAYSRSHLTQLGESYRKIRNTARFLLGNLADFDPVRDPIAIGADADPLDVYLANRLATLSVRLREAYENYEIHVVLRNMIEFCGVDLSARYLDVRKDRLYCDSKTSPARRATQSLLYQSLRLIAHYTAPILCFTAEDIWQHMAKRETDSESVHLAAWPAAEPMVEIAQDMEPLFAIRDRVLKQLESFRAQKKSSLDAHVVLRLGESEMVLVKGLSIDWLSDFFIVSQVTLEPGSDIEIREATGHRCERCWKWTASAPLCARCTSVMEQIKA